MFKGNNESERRKREGYEDGKEGRKRAEGKEGGAEKRGDHHYTHF